MIFKGNNLLFAIDKSVVNQNSDFYYFDLLQNISISQNIERSKQKSIGNELSDRFIFSNKDLKLDITYFQKDLFLQETYLGFNLNGYTLGPLSVLSNFKNNFFIKNAYILIDEKNTASDLTNKIIEDNFSTDLVGIYLNKLFLENYSFNYSIGSLPVVNASFSFQDINVANLIYSNPIFFIKDSENNNIQLSKTYVEKYKERSLSSNNPVTFRVNQFKFQSNFSTLNSFHPDISNFLNGIIQSLDFNIDLSRIKNYFFNSGNNPFDRTLIYPVNGSFKLSGITNFFNKKSLSDFLKNDKKFSLEISIGDKNNQNSNYSEIQIENIYLDSFSYNIGINNSMNYELNASFEINESGGFFMKKINYPNDPLMIGIRSSENDTLTAKNETSPIFIENI